MEGAKHSLAPHRNAWVQVYARHLKETVFSELTAIYPGI